MLEPILNRRSVRFYKDQPISDDDIALVLKAGFCAPSAHNERRWHVVVVKDQERRDKMAGIHRWAKMLSRVPVVIVVAIDRGESEFDHFWIEDGAAFMENMLIQATELGLGSCWVGIRGVMMDGIDAEKTIREACDLPDHFGIVALTPLGYAARHPGPHEPALPDGRVHYESYNS